MFTLVPVNRTARSFASACCGRGKLFCILLCLLLSVAGMPASGLCQEKLPFAIPRTPEQLPKTALIETTQGPIEIAFYREEAPITVAGFVYLGKKGFYENLIFHRYHEDFVIQGGDPEGTGKGGPGYTLPPEFSNLRHRKGTLGMARHPSQVNPERRSNGSQFYICLADSARHLDGLYTVFAQVINGMENAEKLRVGDKILRVAFAQD